jgi:hypothetical protein
MMTISLLGLLACYAAGRLRIIQTGNLNLYLAYIFVTLILLLLTVV